MSCSDPLYNYLKDFGYSVIRLPRADVRPLQLLVKDGGTTSRIGELTTLFTAGGAAPPPVAADTPVAELAGKRTANLSLGLALSLLSGFIKGFGGGDVGLEAKYRQAKTLTFTFHDVFSDSVEFLKLDQFLHDAHHASTETTETMLERDAVYAITATLKSPSVSVDAFKSSGESLGVTVPAIQAAVKGDVSVSADAAHANQITFAGKTPLTFGFQAARIFWEDGTYGTLRHQAPGGMALAPRHRRSGSRTLAAPGTAIEPYVSETPFARVRFS